MWDIAALESLNRRATREAARRGSVPLLVSQADIDRWLWLGKCRLEVPLTLPYVGYRTPRGWRRVNLEAAGLAVPGTEPDAFGDGAYFVAPSWHGDDGVAWSLRRLVENMVPGLAYGWIERGQFQGYVGIWEPRQPAQASGR